MVLEKGTKVSQMTFPPIISVLPIPKDMFGGSYSVVYISTIMVPHKSSTHSVFFASYSGAHGGGYTPRDTCGYSYSGGHMVITLVIILSSAIIPPLGPYSGIPRRVPAALAYRDAYTSSPYSLCSHLLIEISIPE